MDKPKKYATATAFRRALEDRLKAIAAKGPSLERLRREVAFDRLLARLFARPDAPWVLKGGYALELRMKEARATQDIDLALRWASSRTMSSTPRSLKRCGMLPGSSSGTSSRSRSAA